MCNVREKEIEEGRETDGEVVERSVVRQTTRVRATIGVRMQLC